MSRLWKRFEEVERIERSKELEHMPEDQAQQ